MSAIATLPKLLAAVAIVATPFGCGGGTADQSKSDAGSDAAVEIPFDAASSPLDTTPLGLLAASMAPGTWAELETENFDADTMQVVVNDEGRRLHIAGWTDDGHWNPSTDQFLYMGFRLKTKFISYSAQNNRWQVLPSFEWPIDSAFGHVYSDNALDARSGTYYHHAADTKSVFRYSVSTQQWDSIAEFPDNSDLATSLEYFPEMGGLLRHGRQGLHFYDDATLGWRELETPVVRGYHSLARYNPILGEMLLVGGTDTERAVTRIDAQGNVTELIDAPVDMTIQADKLLVHPQTGHYLFFTGQELFDFDSQEQNFVKVEDYTVPEDLTFQVPAAVPELGVIMFVDTAVRLYKPLNIGG